MLLATDITIGQALSLSGVAMAIITGILSLIMGLIYLVAYLLKQFDKMTAKKAQQALAKKTPELTEETAPLYAKGLAGQVKLYNVQDKDAAMIMAIVADKTGIPLNELRFISIKQTNQGGLENEI